MIWKNNLSQLKRIRLDFKLYIEIQFLIFFSMSESQYCLPSTTNLKPHALEAEEPEVFKKISDQLGRLSESNL